MTFTPGDTDRLAQALADVIEDGATPGGVISLGTAGEEPRILAKGQLSPDTPDASPSPTTHYDIASLTKVVATWPLVMRAVNTGRMDLHMPVRTYLPSIDGLAPSGEATVRQLLTHTAGLRASTRLDQHRGSRVPLHEHLLREPTESAPGAHRYINRGYILLGLALAHVYGERLDVLADGLWSALGMHSTTYGPLPRCAGVAPTEARFPDTPRMWGTAHDDNAVLLGGVAGHAGVFSTAPDLARYAEHLLTDGATLNAALHASSKPVVPIEAGLDRGLSWIIAPGDVVYHHGFTGTSLYLNIATGRYIVICTNAVHNGAERVRIAPLRALALKTITAT